MSGSEVPPILRPSSFQQHSFPSRPPNRGDAAPAGVVVNGVKHLNFKPATLTLVAGKGQPDIVGQFGVDAAPPIQPTLECINVQIRGDTGGGAWYLRRLSLSEHRAVQIDVTGWNDLWVEILASNLVDVPFYANVSNQPQADGALNRWIYAETYAAAGRYLTPPGALRVFPAVADGGFSWETVSPTAPVAIADPLAAAVATPVKGTHFVTTAVPFAATWDIQL